MAKYERTRLCGCGECRMRPASEGPCPLEKSKTAKWLWGSTPGNDEDEDVDLVTGADIVSSEDIEDSLDTPEVEGATEEEILLVA